MPGYALRNERNDTYAWRNAYADGRQLKVMTRNSWNSHSRTGTQLTPH